MSFLHALDVAGHKPFTIGAQPLDPAAWMEPDHHLLRDLALKDEILRGHRNAAVRLLEQTEAAQREVCALVLAHLLADHPHRYARESDDLVIDGTRRVSLTSDAPPLVTCARWVQEDLCLMRREASGWRLVAGVLCFPSGWSLAEKIGADLPQVHGPVPGFAGRMAETVTRMFDRITPDRPLLRWNWSVYGDGRMRQEPGGEGWDRFPPGQALEGAHLRVERQCLRRLPASGDILFTIRIHSDALSDLAAHPQGPRLAGALRAQILSLTPEQLAYKGLAPVRADLCAWLERMATR